MALLTRGVGSSASPVTRTATNLTIIIGAAMVAASAVIHLHLWQSGYRHIHLIGPAFLAQSITGMALATFIVVYRRVVGVAAGALYSAGSAAALIISATVGFLGLHDGLDVPWAGWSLATELIGLVMFLGALTSLLRRR